jgi:hypothetical protein
LAENNLTKQHPWMVGQVATAIRGGIIAAKLNLIPVRRGFWGNRPSVQKKNVAALVEEGGGLVSKRVGMNNERRAFSFCHLILLDKNKDHSEGEDDEIIGTCIWTWSQLGMVTPNCESSCDVSHGCD